MTDDSAAGEIERLRADLLVHRRMIGELVLLAMEAAPDNAKVAENRARGLLQDLEDDMRGTTDPTEAAAIKEMIRYLRHRLRDMPWGNP
jgi:hypothetical protein